MDEQPPLGISVEDWAATPPAVRAVVHALLLRITDLEARLNQHSRNSSKPPSSDPPSAPPRPPKVQRGRQRGGQPGHPGHHRPLLPPDDDRIQEIIPVPPAQCDHCAALLDPTLPDARDRQRHQRWDIPPIQPVVTEFQLRALACPHCGEVTRASLPPGVSPMGYTARVISITNLLHGRYRMSDRDTAEVLETVFGVPMGDGTVTATEHVMSAALAAPYQEVQTTTQATTRANVDETPWKQGTAGVAGKRKGWLWVAVTQVCTLFLV